MYFLKCGNSRRVSSPHNVQLLEDAGEVADGAVEGSQALGQLRRISEEPGAQQVPRHAVEAVEAMEAVEMGVAVVEADVVGVEAVVEAVVATVADLLSD